MSRNIELIRYRKFGDSLLLLDLLTTVSTSASPQVSVVASGAPTKATRYKTNAESLADADQNLANLYSDVETFMLGLGDDVIQKELRNYFAFKRIKNFACVEVKPQIGVIRLYLKIDPDTIELVEGFSRDVRKVGHFETGDFEITLKTHEDFGSAKDLIVRSYEAS